MPRGSEAPSGAAFGFTRLLSPSHETAPDVAPVGSPSPTDMESAEATWVEMLHKSRPTPHAPDSPQERIRRDRLLHLVERQRPPRRRGGALGAALEGADRAGGADRGDQRL